MFSKNLRIEETIVTLIAKSRATAKIKFPLEDMTVFL